MVEFTRRNHPVDLVKSVKNGMKFTMHSPAFGVILIHHILG